MNVFQKLIYKFAAGQHAVSIPEKQHTENPCNRDLKEIKPEEPAPEVHPADRLLTLILGAMPKPKADADGDVFYDAPTIVDISFFLERAKKIWKKYGKWML